MQVRRATRDDLNGIGRVADAVHWHGYRGLLAPATIRSLIRRDYGPPALKRRLLRGWLLVAEQAVCHPHGPVLVPAHQLLKAVQVPARGRAHQLFIASHPGLRPPGCSILDRHRNRCKRPHARASA